MIASWVLALGSLGEAVNVSPEAVDRAVREVLADPAYAEALKARSGAMEEMLRWLSSAVPRLIGWILEKAVELHEAAPAVFWLTFLALSVLLFLLVMHIGWTLTVAFRRSPGTGAGAGDPEARRERARQSVEILDEARRLAIEGRMREALHGLLLSVLALVEERRILRIARGWTHREIASRLRVPEPLKEDLRELHGTIESVWYGKAKATSDDFERCDAAARRLTAGLLAPGSPEVPP